MKKIIPFLMVLILVSCSRRADMEVLPEGLTISHPDLRIKKHNMMDWRVGLGGKKVKVTKGMIIRFEIPHLSKSDLNELVEKYQVNSWLVQVSRRFELSGQETLGRYYIPFQIQRKRGVGTIDLSDSLFKVYYAASSMSQRFANLPCPAFGHDRLVTDVEIERISDNKERSFVVRGGSEVKGKVVKTDFVAVDFNAGRTMLGAFEIHIALYNSRTNTTYSEFIPLNERLVVRNERSLNIPGCAGYRVPPKRDRPPIPKKLW